MSEITSFVLFDAAALSEQEQTSLRNHGDSVWLYADVADPHAVAIGPVWAPLNDHNEALLDQMWIDTKRWWGASKGTSLGNFSELDRHFRSLRYVRTHDEQRYFFRFADARCVLAMSSALVKSRLPNLTGPISSWLLLDRNGQQKDLRGREPASALNGIRLSANELASLLQAAWPDQLLSAVDHVEHLPRSSSATPWSIYSWATQLCEMFRLHEVEAYPVQVEALALVLSTDGAALHDPRLPSILVNAQQEGSVDLIVRHRDEWEVR